jgi:predicted RNase H-like nuclease
VVVGVDAHPRGWIAAADDGRVEIERSFEELLRTFSQAEVVGVDIPIELPVDEPRAAELAARAFLGARRSSIFLTYPRPVLEAAGYAQALELARAMGWPGISKQSYGLRRRIFEVVAVLEPRVIEVHPEVSFRELAGRELASKHRPEGLEERRALLGRPAASHHELDAVIVAWTAGRYARGEAQPLPEGAAGPGVIWR